MSRSLPKSTKALTLQKSTLQRKHVYHDAVLKEQPIPVLQTGQILVKLAAASFNRRDLWIRMGQYPGLVMGSTFGSDGSGKVIASAQLNDPLLDQRVFLTPMRGWEDHPDAPETRFGILGGGSHPPIGTFAEHVVVERDQVVLAPSYLDDIHLAAWPLGGLTAWRAAIINAGVEAGQNILITGIGGGVAVIALQLCLAKGANVYVTSGNVKKIRKAVEMGAKGGVNYREKDWPEKLAALLRNGSHGLATTLDSVIDSAGGDIMGQVSKCLKLGGRVVCYGMTSSPKITFTMREVLKHQRLIGSTMGSHKDMVDATNFMAEHCIVPVVSHILPNLESAEEGFELMKRSDQFGKIVIRIGGEDAKAKL